eukprot:4660-Eustigmatos_ZCMA.PRE.1
MDVMYYMDKEQRQSILQEVANRSKRRTQEAQRQPDSDCRALQHLFFMPPVCNAIVVSMLRLQVGYCSSVIRWALPSSSTWQES